jgi:hypothetical protein
MNEVTVECYAVFHRSALRKIQVSRSNEGNFRVTVKFLDPRTLITSRQVSFFQPAAMEAIVGLYLVGYKQEEDRIYIEEDQPL